LKRPADHLRPHADREPEQGLSRMPVAMIPDFGFTCQAFFLPETGKQLPGEYGASSGRFIIKGAQSKANHILKAGGNGDIGSNRQREASHQGGFPVSAETGTFIGGGK